MKVPALIIASIMLLTACGGSNTTTTTKPKVTITSVTTDQLVYRKNSKITVVGTNFDTGFNMNHQGCLTLTELAGSTTTQKVFSCKMVGAGQVPVTISDAAGNTLYAATVTIPLANPPQVTMTTTKGSIVLELDPSKAPITVDNFLNYAEAGFYVNKTFHRVIKDFMIQGGGFTSDMVQAPTLAPIKLEAGKGLSNLRGTIAMARTSALDSATSQFFINVVDNVALDTNAGGYAVFGKVITGMDVVDQIKVVPTGVRAGFSDVPTTDILIQSMVQTK